MIKLFVEWTNSHRGHEVKKFDIRAMLNEIKWNEEGGLEEVELHYVSRGEPGDEGILNGAEIKAIAPSGVETQTKLIPYHRIFRIVHRGKVLLDRS